jgi:hypothetical protein
MSQYYRSTQQNTSLNLKQVYSREEVEYKLRQKADRVSVYSKSESDYKLFTQMGMVQGDIFSIIQALSPTVITINSTDWLGSSAPYTYTIYGPNDLSYPVRHKVNYPIIQIVNSTTNSIVDLSASSVSVNINPSSFRITLSAPTKFSCKVYINGASNNPVSISPALQDGSEALPSLSFLSAANTGIYSPASQVFGISAGGVERLRITPTGFIGVNKKSPQVALDVIGSSAISGDLVIGGNLTVSGTTTSIQSTITQIKDPVIQLGKTTAPINSNDGLDRGIEINYYDSAARIGFFGRRNSTGEWALLDYATSSSSNVYSGTPGTLRVGSLKINNLTSTYNSNTSRNEISSSDPIAFTTPVSFSSTNTNGYSVVTDGDTRSVAQVEISTISIPSSPTPTAVTVDTLSASQYRSGEWMMQVTDTSNSLYQVTKFMVLHNGVNPPLFNNFGTLRTSPTDLGIIDAVLSSGSLIIRFTPVAFRNMVVKLSRIALGSAV